MEREYDKTQPVNKEALSVMVKKPEATKVVLKNRMMSSNGFNKWLDSLIEEIKSK